VNVRGLIGLRDLTIPHPGLAFVCDTSGCVPCLALSAWMDMQNLTFLLGAFLETFGASFL